MSNNVDYSGREPSFLCYLGNYDSCRDGREFRWFHHDGVTGSHRRYDGSPGQDICAVPWRETCDNAKWTPYADRVGTGRIGFQNLAFGQIHPACDLLERRGNQVLLERSERKRHS